MQKWPTDLEVRIKIIHIKWCLIVTMDTFLALFWLILTYFAFRSKVVDNKNKK